MEISKKTRIAAIITLSFFIMMLVSMTQPRTKMETPNKKLETKNK
jgi:hypothetical protein